MDFTKSAGALMPRSKANETIIHRIELGSWERSRAEAMIDAFVFNRVGTPIVAALSDVSFVLMVGSALAAWKYIDAETWDALAGAYEEGKDTAATAVGWMAEAYQRTEYAVGETADLGGSIWDFITDPLNRRPD